MAFANCFGILGYILIICDTSFAVKYFATFLCAVAVYNGPGLNLTWLNVNVAPHCAFRVLHFMNVSAY